MPKTASKKPQKSPRKRPVQARSRATFQVILEAAARILEKRGLSAMTTNHVARAAGVSIGTLYEYFPNKDAIVYALLDEHLHEAELALSYVDAAFVARALTLPIERIVERLVATVVLLHAKKPGLHRTLFEEGARLTVVRERAEALERRIVELVVALFRGHPELHLAQPELQAQVVVRTVESLVHGWVTQPNSAPAERNVFEREIVRLVSAYLRA